MHLRFCHPRRSQVAPIGYVYIDSIREEKVQCYGDSYKLFVSSAKFKGRVVGRDSAPGRGAEWISGAGDWNAPL
jgi:hypothetical protein